MGGFYSVSPMAGVPWAGSHVVLCGVHCRMYGPQDVPPTHTGGAHGLYVALCGRCAIQSVLSRCARHPGGFVTCIWGSAYPASAYRDSLLPPAVLAALMAAAVLGDMAPASLPSRGARVAHLSGLACVTV